MLNKNVMINISPVDNKNVDKFYINWLHNNGYKYVVYKNKIHQHKQIPNTKMIILYDGKITNKQIQRIAQFLNKKHPNEKIMSEDYRNIFKAQIKNNIEVNKTIGKIKIYRSGSKWI